MLRCSIAAWLLFFEGAEGCVELSPSGESLYEWGEVASSLEEMARVNPSLRFGKIDFVDAAMPAYRRSEFLQHEFDYYNVGDGCHELALSGVNKGSGVRAFIEALCAHAGTGHVRTYAFGDSENDLAMLEAVDVSVAMGQAASHVRNRVDYVTDSCANDGVATALTHLGLI